MRIKFDKGLTPERIADAFVNYIYENKIVIGIVNMYIQTYDEEMKPENFNKNNDGSYLICKPSETAKKEYAEYAASIRRGNFKAVVNK
jgi:hypothetical protein